MDAASLCSNVYLCSSMMFLSHDLESWLHHCQTPYHFHFTCTHAYEPHRIAMWSCAHPRVVHSHAQHHSLPWARLDMSIHPTGIAYSVSSRSSSCHRHLFPPNALFSPSVSHVVPDGIIYHVTCLIDSTRHAEHDGVIPIPLACLV